LLPAPGGGIVTLSAGRSGAGTAAVVLGGAPVMEWLIGTAVGFLVVTAAVMGLARRSTAEWEREKRAARAPRREAAAVPPPPAGVAARLRHASVRTAAAAPRVAGALAGSLKQGLDVLTPPERVLSWTTPVRRALGTLGSAVPAAVIRRWRRGTPGTGDLSDGGEQNEAGAAVPQPPPHRAPRRRRSENFRRRRPFRLPHRPHRGRVGASRPAPDQSPEALTPGSPPQSDPG